MEEIKAMERIYKMLKQNFEPVQIKRILTWLENRFDEEIVKAQEKRREELVRERRFASNVVSTNPTISSGFDTGTNHTGVDQTFPQNFRTD